MTRAEMDALGWDSCDIIIVTGDAYVDHPSFGMAIIGRFLEHSRIYYFSNEGKPKIYLGSADLMPRNLNRRVEVLFPVESTELTRRIRTHILKVLMEDNVKARLMLPDGNNRHLKPRSERTARNAQEIFIKAAHQRSKET